MANRINEPYTYGYISNIAFLFFKVGYAFAAFGTYGHILYDQLDAAGVAIIEDKETFLSVMTGALLIAGVFGAIFAGELCKIGRRKATMIIGVLFIISNILTAFFDFYMILGGRILMGVCMGGFTMIVPLFVNEMSPGPICSPLGVIGQVMGCSGVVLALVLGLWVPYSDDEAAKTTNIWRVISALPALFSVGQIIMFQVYYDHETPTYYLVNNDYPKYEMAMRRQYFDFGSGALLEEKNNEVPKLTEFSWIEQFSPPQLRQVFIGILIGVFQQASGLGCVGYFSGEIFTEGYTGSEAEHALRIDKLFMAVIGLLAGVIAYLISAQYGRRAIIQAGQVVMLFLLAVLSNCAIVGQYNLMMVATLAYSFTINVSYSAFLWLFISEILGRNGVAAVASANFAAAFFFKGFAGTLFELLSASGVFFGFFFLQLAGIFLFYQYVKETKDKDHDTRRTMYLNTEENREKDKVEMAEF